MRSSCFFTGDLLGEGPAVEGGEGRGGEGRKGRREGEGRGRKGRGREGKGRGGEGRGGEGMTGHMDTTTNAVPTHLTESQLHLEWYCVFGRPSHTGPL